MSTDSSHVYSSRAPKT